MLARFRPRGRALALIAATLTTHVVQSAPAAHDFALTDASGRETSFAEATDNKRVVLAVNVASQCGLTASNYAGLQELQEEFGHRSFTVLAFPANDFGGQEPASNEEIQVFAEDKGATFPVLGKVSVTGPDAHPLWKWMTEQPSEAMGVASFLPGPRWNFHKVLLLDGKVKQHYTSTTSPAAIRSDIDSVLKELGL